MKGMTVTCPNCGSEDAGLGYCWDCHHDSREASTSKAVAPKQAEEQIQRAIKDLLHLHGFEYVDTSQPRATKITPGLSDLIVMGVGRIAFVEVKRPGGKQSEAQRLFQGLCEIAGATYEIWRSTDDALDWIEEGP